MRGNPNYYKFRTFFIGGVDSLTIKVKQKNLLARGNPNDGKLRKLKFENHFIKNVPSGDVLGLAGYTQSLWTFWS